MLPTNDCCYHKNLLLCTLGLPQLHLGTNEHKVGIDICLKRSWRVENKSLFLQDFAKKIFSFIYVRNQLFCYFLFHFTVPDPIYLKSSVAL